MNGLNEIITCVLRYRESVGQTFKNRDKAINDAENAARKAIIEAITKSLDEAER